MAPDETPASSTDPTQALAAELGELAWFEVDAQRRVVRWSAAAAALTGFSVEEALATPCVAVVRCHRCLAGCRVFDRGQANGIVSIFHDDGRDLSVRKIGRVLLDEEGQIRGAVEVLLPVVEVPTRPGRDRTIDLVSEALGRLWLASDGDFRVVDASLGFLGDTGWSHEELLGKQLAELLGGDLWAEVSSFRAALTRGERREGRSANLLLPDGQRRAVSVSAGPGSDGRVHVMIRPQEEVASEHRGYVEFQGMVARSASMLRLFHLVEVLGDSDASVLVTGESGTGKELVARAVHNTSGRARGPFVAVNCGALPAELLESELFGHVRGAFTGAVRDRPGRFELAQGGSLFLDEIGDLPLPLQVKLLRVLEDRTYQRVGESKTRTADVRVIAATNVVLRDAVANKRFREDLFYRLRVLPIDIPPLRARREDLAPLVEHLLAQIARQRGRAVQLSPTATRCLLAWSWPGNVRELENTLEYAVAVCEGQTVHVRDLPPELRLAVAGEGALGEALFEEGALGVGAPGAVRAEERAAAEGVGEAASGEAASGEAGSGEAASGEAAEIRQALVRARYRREEAARTLGMSRTTLWRKMKQLGLA